MPLITPSSQVSLYSGIDITDGQQIAFTSVSQQTSYFKRKRVTSEAACTYVRRTGTIKIEWPTSQVQQCNYISFTNPAFENKTIYAHIIDYNYINNVTTEIRYSIDWFQTMMFDVKYVDGLIDREHLSESDYNKSVNNPYDPSIYEFQTDEGLASARSIEEIHSGSDVNTFPLISGSGVVAIELAAFDYPIWTGSGSPNPDEDMGTGITFKDWDAFLSIAEKGRGFMLADGGNGTGGTGSLQGLTPVARGYGIFTFSATDKKNFSDLLSWINIHNMVGNIIGIFQVSDAMWSIYTGKTANSSYTFNPPSYNVENKKLNLAPFQYIRVHNNEGDIKEYHYEKFADIQRGGYGTLKFIACFDGVPMASLMPVDYMNDNGYNIDERIDCHQIPQVGYCTDAFLSFVSSQYQMNVASRTDNVENWARNIGASMGGAGNWIAGILGGIANAGSAVSGAISGAQAGAAGGVASAAAGGIAGAVSGIPQIITGGVAAYENQRTYQEASDWMSGNRGDYIDGVFGPARAAFVADQYHGGSANGFLGYYTDHNQGPGTYTIVKVQLKDSVIQQYDRYFTAYGYASRRVGLPRVCNYIMGSGTQPHFHTLDGYTFTYVKTTGMKVVHSMVLVSDYIQRLFDNGCRFVKGATL